MIDWHSHVLPNMDDGSQSVEQSLEMLESFRSQGVRHVVATPHFYADENSIESFIERRNSSYGLLAPQLRDGMPQLHFGAEVKYYAGISRLEGIERLAIDNTKLILVEMPMTKWTSSTVNELFELSATRRLTVIIAHVERYIGFQDKSMLDSLCENGVLIQVNASYFEGLFDRRKAIKQLASGEIHFIGSDCHNMTSRPPKISEAYDIIEKKLGERFVHEMNSFGYSMLGV